MSSITGLRWALLLVGLLFLVTLAAWESRRSRRARSEESASRAAAGFASGSREQPGTPASLASRHRELPPCDAPGSAPRVHEVPLDETVQDDVLPVQGRHAEPSLGELPEESVELCVPIPLEAAASSDAELIRATPPTEVAADGNAGVGASEMQVGPRVDWPAEEERQIVSVRIVGMNQERLPGRAVRLALAACGFVHGRYRIFHQPAADGRALLSCASLSKPGNFDPASMDFQRYAGLSLFTVLPGPMPAAIAMDRLFESARDLTQRLQAQLQDERGKPLDSARMAALRHCVWDARERPDATRDAMPEAMSAAMPAAPTQGAAATDAEPVA